MSELEPLLKASEVAAILGFSSSTVQDWSEAGKLPGFRVGGRLRFRESEVLEWLEERRLEATVASRPGTV